MGTKVEKTDNVDFCLKKLKEALEDPADTGKKKTALDAYEYLTNSFDGVSQPAGGSICPKPMRIKPEG